jgi:hypothetical protein
VLKKLLNFEAFQAGMTTLSKIGNWKDSSPVINHVNSTETRVEFSFSVYRRVFFRFQKRQITFQETKLSKIDNQHIAKSAEKCYISCDSHSFRDKSTILKYIILLSYFELLVIWHMDLFRGNAMSVGHVSKRGTKILTRVNSIEV